MYTREWRHGNSRENLQKICSGAIVEKGFDIVGTEAVEYEDIVDNKRERVRYKKDDNGFTVLKWIETVDHVKNKMQKGEMKT